MGILFVYILKSGACLALFYLFYRLLLSKDTFHHFNRFALLGVIIFSTILPFITFRTTQNVSLSSIFIETDKLVAATEYAPMEKDNPFFLYGVLLIYGIGVIYFLFLMFRTIIRLLILFRKEEKIKLEDGSNLILTDYPMDPFSWMNYIVISKEDWEENGQEILLHEQGHVRFRHSWDLLICQFCIAFHWFNPASWLLKQELQNIHEYEADSNVLNQGVNAKNYQLLLIKKAVGTQRFTSMANSFNHSKLKKRITMMLKNKSNPWARLKYLYILPLGAVVVTTFAQPEISTELEKISSIKVNEIISSKQSLAEIDKKEIIVTEPVQVNTIIEKLNVDIAGVSGNIGNIEIDLTNSVDGQTQVSHTITTQLEGVELDELNQNIETLLKDVDVTTKVEPRVREVEVKVSSMDMLFVVDGLEISAREFEEKFGSSVNTIDQMRVLKDADAIQKYGERGREGVIEIISKK